MKIGILGAGQLARMLALAGKPLGFQFVFLDPAPQSCAAEIGEHLLGAYDDHTMLSEMANRCDVVTYEFENIPVHVVEHIAATTPVYPSARALAVAQDRLAEKSFFKQQGIPTAPFESVNSLEELRSAAEAIGYPAILKTRTLGYDGKGQVLIQSSNDLDLAWESIKGVPSILEGFVKFQREVSIIAARNVSGEVVFYPLSENQHEKGILRLATCCVKDPLQSEAEGIISNMLEALDYVGILALELFDMDGHLVANEFAPRVHNSGHWTIEGAEVSQFENHLRAVTDMPLGRTSPLGFTAMQNFIGGVPSLKEILALRDVHMHFYNKAPRKGRKIAHATIRSTSKEVLNKQIETLSILAWNTDNS